jgi:hypothetical protein
MVVCFPSCSADCTALFCTTLLHEHILRRRVSWIPKGRPSHVHGFHLGSSKVSRTELTRRRCEQTCRTDPRRTGLGKPVPLPGWWRTRALLGKVTLCYTDDTVAHLLRYKAGSWASWVFREESHGLATLHCTHTLCL